MTIASIILFSATIVGTPPNPKGTGQVAGYISDFTPSNFVAGLTDIRSCGRTNLLHITARFGRPRLARLLITCGFDPNAPDIAGNTPLELAILHQHADVINLLRPTDHPPNLPSLNFTLLEMRIWYGELGAAQALLSEGAKLNICSAAGLGMTDRVRLFLKANKELVHLESPYGCTPLHWAVQCKQIDVARLLLDHNAPPNSGNGSGRINLLKLAVRSKNLEMTKLLIERGVSLQTVNLLHEAVQHGTPEIVAVLLANGVLPDSREFKAVYLKDFTPTKSGPSFDPARESTPTGDTPLHLAARLGHVQIAQILLNYRANANATGENDFTPLETALQSDHADVVQLISRHGGTTRKKSKSQ